MENPIVLPLSLPEPLIEKANSEDKENEQPSEITKEDSTSNQKLSQTRIEPSAQNEKVNEYIPPLTTENKPTSDQSPTVNDNPSTTLSEDTEKTDKENTLGNQINNCQSQIQETNNVLNQILDQLLSSRKNVQEKMSNKENSNASSAEGGRLTLAEIQKKKEELLSGLSSNITLQNLTQNQQRKLVGKDTRENKNAGRNNMFLLQQKRLKDANINEMLNVSIKSVKYGTVISGNIFEEDLEIQNRQIDSLVVKVLVQCHNSQFDDHDEYVFSVRKTSNYDYNEKFVVIIPPMKQHLFKIAMKVPNIREQLQLRGSVIISIQGVDSQIVLPITALVEIPSIICTKELFSIQNGMEVIKLAVKKGKKPDCKIPFKNCSASNYCIECEWLQDNQTLSYDFLIHPPQLNITAKNLFILTIIMKQKTNDQANDEEVLKCQSSTSSNLSINKVLLIKIKNSNVMMSYPVIIEIFD